MKRQSLAKIEEELDDIEKQVDLETSRKQLEKILQDNPWGLSPKAIEAKKAAASMISTKTGLYARIPIICKGEDCPYSQSCILLAHDLAPRGEYCPTELAQIEALSKGYCQDIDYDDMSFTDRCLINEIVGLDIMLERCKGLMAQEGTPVIDVTIGVSEAGEEIRQPSVSKAWEAYEKMTKQKNQKLQLLAMTRDARLKNKDQQKDKESWMQQIARNITDEDLRDYKETIESSAD